MTITVEWRTGAYGEVLLLVDESSLVAGALPADESLLTSFLTGMDLDDAWPDRAPLHSRSPDSWGDVVIIRAMSGEVIFVDPELFWDRIYRIYRAKGIDYDTVV
jgi:hypothetical protein